MADLQSYKAWAEAKIALLIQRMREGERQRREEATRVSAEATQLKKVCTRVIYGRVTCKLFVACLSCPGLAWDAGQCQESL